MDLENFGGYAIQAVWNVPGTRVVAFYHLPFDKCRVNQDASKVWYSEDWADRRTDKLEFPAFNPEEPGGTQVLWFKQYRAGEGVYPLPDWYPARTYIEIDTKIADFHYNNITNGFSLGKIIQIFKGEPTEDIKSEFDRKFKANTTGTENANGVLISWMEKGEDPLQVVDLMPGDFDKQYLQLSETVRDNIFYAHRVTSPMLFGVRVEGQLGGRNELTQAYEVFDRAYVAPKREQMERIFTRMFQAMGYEGKIGTVLAEPAAQDTVQLFTAGILDRNELRIVAVIRDNPKATLEEIAKGARVKKEEATKVIKTMQDKGLVTWDKNQIKITDSGAQSIAESGGVDTEIFVLYQYGVNPDVGGKPIIDGTREFCRFLIGEKKLYTREEIDAMSAELDYDVWKRRGGWRTIKGTTTHVPQCRHVWNSKLYRRRIG
jgi:predicted transcriptional regulator